MSAKPTYFFSDKPIFGFDIGHSSLKVMQLETLAGVTSIVGYGTANFDTKAIVDGVIVNPQIIADVVVKLFKTDMIGQITTRRAAMALPNYRTFTRSIQLPKLGPDELREAVQLEVEQYVPLPLQELYLDYVITNQLGDQYELFVVACPKKVVDSYLMLTRALGIEVILIEPTTASCARFFSKDKQSDIPSLIIDFGSLTANISIVNNRTIVATGTVSAGGLVFTEAIGKRLHINMQEAGDIKTEQGLDHGPFQKEISEALKPSLDRLETEIRRMLRYYEERYGTTRPIGQVIMLGGGSNMPGLAGYLTDTLKMPVRTHSHPWSLFEHKGLRPPLEADRLMFATVAGLSLLNPSEVFA